MNSYPLDVKTVDRLFCHRVHAIVACPAIRRRNLEERKDLWKDFIDLWSAIRACPSYQACESFAPGRRV